MLSRRSFLGSSAAISIAPYFISVGNAATPKNIVVMAKTIDGVQSLDPAEGYEVTTWEVCGNLYQSLVTPDPSDPSKLQGDIAESWTVSEDSLNFAFHIRKDIKFASGGALTAEDVAFSLQRVVKLDKAPAGLLTQFGWTRDNVDKLITATDKYVLTLTLPEKQAPALVLYCLSTLAGGVVEKSEALAHQSNGDFGNTWLKTHSAGSGPYHLMEWQASDHITLVGNRYATVQPVIERVVIRHVADPATQLLLLRKGDVDLARNLGADQLASITANEDLTTVSSLTTNTMGLGMNMGLPQFQKPQVVEAVKRAIDYDAIAQNITKGVWRVSQTWLPSGIPGAIGDRPYKKDVARAKALLAEAGFAGGFSVTLDHFSGWPFTDIAQAIQADLAAVGITVKLLAGEKKQVISRQYSRQTEMVLFSSFSDYLDAYSMGQWYISNEDDTDHTALKTAAWTAHFADKEMNAEIDATVTETDTAKRLQIFEKLQREFMQRAPFAFMLQQMEVDGARKNVSGFKAGTLPAYTRYSGITKA